MQALFASKIYRGLSSVDKAHVRAAINDPINVELVTQLKSYLDDEYQAIFAPKEDTKVETEDVERVDTTSDDKDSFDKPTGGVPSFHSSGAPMKSFGDKVDDIEEDLGELPDGDTPDEISTDETETKEDETDETDEVKSSTVVASVDLDTPSVFIATDEIKGTLNFDAATNGVSRVVIKDDELWIYYFDNYNLNNVMNEVIDKLNAAGWVGLSFSRLARTDNAIVFDINHNDTDNVIKPVTDEDEK